MIFSQDRAQIRLFFIEVWAKSRAQLPLEPLEKIIADILCAHPEYQDLVGDKDAALDKDYLPELGESNPFLHMGMHIAIREQLATNRPIGILDAYQALCAKLQDPHEAEHRMLECLGEMLWHAQRDGANPDESAYLDCLRRLVCV